MKKLFLFSGIALLLFGLLFISGIADFHHTVSRALTAGNRHYNAEAFDAAIAAYETGLQKEADNPLLNFNAAQASYRAQAYEKAVEFCGKSPASVDRYLLQGNASFRLGEKAADANIRLQHYSAAVKTYQEGILSFPQSMELKFNYEFVLEKMKELQDNTENQPQENPENQKESGQDQQQGQNSQEGSGQDQQQDQNSQEDGQDQQNSQQGAGEDQQGSEGEQQDQQAGENEGTPPDKQEDEQQSQAQEQQGNPQEASGEDEQQAQSAAGDKEDNAQDAAGGSVQNLSEIERILQMLEKQEEDALKNNQQIRGSGEEDEHDW